MNHQQICDYIKTKGVWGEGYGSQQWQWELASLIDYLQPDADKFRRFLEIGAAAGGTARILHELLHFESIHILDDNALGMQEHRHQNIPDAVEWIGDSLSEECRAAVEAWGMQFDLIHIDAGHTYECVSSDTRLAVTVAAPGAIVTLHDVLCCDGCKQWLEELKGGAVPGLEYIRTFGSNLGEGVLRWKSKSP